MTDITPANESAADHDVPPVNTDEQPAGDDQADEATTEQV